MGINRQDVTQPRTQNFPCFSFYDPAPDYVLGTSCPPGLHSTSKHCRYIDGTGRTNYCFHPYLWYALQFGGLHRDNNIVGVFCLLYSQLIVVYMFVNSLRTRNYGNDADYRKKDHRSWGQLCIFLISTATFLVATVHGAALISYTGILVHSALTTYQNLPLAQRLPLVYRKLRAPDAVWAWTAKFGVSVLVYAVPNPVRVLMKICSL